MADLEKLRELGAHKIYEQTHIARRFVQNILDENFSTMNKIQFAGFISILEREYSVDLHELIEIYNDKFNEEESNEAPFVVSIQESNEKESNKALYVALPIAILAVVFFMYNFNTSSPETKEPTALIVEEETSLVNIDSEFNNTTIAEAKVNLDHMDNATNPVQALTQEKVVEEVITIEPIHPSKFEVNPRSKLWIGIIDLETYERKQKLTSEAFDLDPEKEWLLVMGHGYVDFHVNGEEKKFADENKMWFGYEKATLTKLKRQEFKDKNRGKAW